MDTHQLGHNHVEPLKAPITHDYSDMSDKLREMDKKYEENRIMEMNKTYEAKMKNFNISISPPQWQEP